MVGGASVEDAAAAQPCLAFVRVWRCGRCVLTRRQFREAEPCAVSCRKQLYSCPNLPPRGC